VHRIKRGMTAAPDLLCSTRRHCKHSPADERGQCSRTKPAASRHALSERKLPSGVTMNNLC
jgi:hypothetical protein